MARDSLIWINYQPSCAEEIMKGSGKMINGIYQRISDINISENKIDGDKYFIIKFTVKKIDIYNNFTFKINNPNSKYYWQSLGKYVPFPALNTIGCIGKITDNKACQDVINNIKLNTVIKIQRWFKKIMHKTKDPPLNLKEKKNIGKDNVKNPIKTIYDKQQPYNNNICNLKKLIKQSYFETLSPEKKCKYIMDGYKTVIKIKTVKEVQYIPHTLTEYCEEDGEYYKFNTYEDYKEYLLTNNALLETLLKYGFNNTKYFNSFTKDIFRIKHKNISHNGRNTEKYPIPTTEAEKCFCVINHNYRCKGIRKNGSQCKWLGKVNGFCPGCIKTNKPLEDTDNAKRKKEYHMFNKNFKEFYNKYYIDGVFNLQLYNNNINKPNIEKQTK